MKTFLKIYFAVLLAFSAITLFPDLTLMVLLLTFGLGLPLVFVPTILLYSIALAPILLLLSAPRRYWIFLPLMVLPALALAFLPAELSRRQLRDYLGDQKRSDVTNLAAAERPSVVEFVEEGASGPYGRREDLYTPCDEICARLLLNGEVRKVRIKRLFRDGRRVSLTYWTEMRNECPTESLPGAVDHSGPVSQMRSAGTCLLASRDDAEPAQVRITSSSWQAPARDPDLAALIYPGPKRRLVVENITQAKPVLIWQQTELTIEELRTPFFIAYDITSLSGHKGRGWVPAREKHVHDPIDATEALRRSLGFALTPVSQAATIPAQPHQESAPPRVSAAPVPPRPPVVEPRPVLAGEELAAANALIKRLMPSMVGPRRELAPDDVERVRQLIADPRVTGLAHFNLLLTDYPSALTRPLLTTILDRLEIRHGKPDDQYRSYLAHAASVLPAADLRPHREQIFRLLQEEDDWPVIWLLRRAGELGGDPSQLLTMHMASSSPRAREAAAIAACRLGPPLASPVVPDLFEGLHRDSADQATPSEVHQRMLLALARLGEKEAATKRFLEQFPRSARTVVDLRLEQRNSGDPLLDCRVGEGRP
ncbi:MAG TPA: hypothetical protein VGJ22_09770 [Anaerolineales bacterium]|jgi:hypothetical protein